VKDLELIRTFYEKYFNAHANNKYHNPKTGLQTYFLSFDDSTRLEIMSRPDISARDKALASYGYIHLAFSVGSKEAVDSITFTLEKDGYKVISMPRTTGDGYYESCILDPEDNQIEIVE
jgi:lactoylglutathione lyase